MMDDEIQALVALGESETLEFKRTTGELREATRSVCAMLNNRGGRVVFGIDREGRIVGQQIGDRTIEELAEELGRIEPAALPSIDRHRLDSGLELITVTVPSGAGRPFAYRGTAYRRVGNTNRVLTSEEYNQMLFERVHSEQRWETQVAAGWRIDDLDAAEIERTLSEAIRRGRVEDPGVRDVTAALHGFGLMRGDELLRAAAVLFGRADRLSEEFSQCLLRVARFRGTTKAEFIDNRQFRGNTFALLLDAERFLLQHVPVASRFVTGQLERVDEPLYPPLAVREALSNAFCHRDYSIGGGSVGVAIYDDRLEITSSGPLHFGLTPQVLFGPHESLPWNPRIANVFFRRGIIESWGRGTIRMNEFAANAGLPPIEIEDVGGHVVVRFRPAQYLAPRQITRQLAERQRRVLEFLSQASGGAAVREIAAALGVVRSTWAIREDLAQLKSLGLVQTSGWGRGARWFLIPE
jgi:ATP-dependent DNA helicase RecG